MKTINGIRPTGKLHLGNYIGSILPARKYDAYTLIAEYHAPEGDPIALYAELVNYVSSNKIIMQSDAFNADLYFKLLQATPTGLLNHMPQYKEKDKNALMFTYPVLMAHDIANFDYVVVGEDQRPHIEFANDILHKIGKKCPEAIYEGGKIMDLRQPTNKMSKSKPNSCLFLSDSSDIRRKKVQKAVTDTAGRANLEFIFRALRFDDIEPPMQNSELKEAICLLLDKHLNQ
jgi:tryptophanyl-tRNA synthetase